jgi:lysophospholipase L1-like esterase
MTFRSAVCLVGSLAVMGSVARSAEAATYDLYYLGGQSNMDGYGRVEELPEVLRGPVDGVMILHGNSAPEIAAFVGGDGKSSPPPRPVLFVGSSSIRFWSTAAPFPACGILNRGFGGAEISDVLHYFEDVVAAYRPRAIFLYAGDNDVWKGKSPARVLGDFQRFVETVRTSQPGTPVYFLAIKPSPTRWDRWRDMEEVNGLVGSWAESEGDVTYVDTATPMLGEDGTPRETLYDEDGLHLSEEGYAVWNAALASYLDGLCPETETPAE